MHLEDSKSKKMLLTSEQLEVMKYVDNVVLVAGAGSGKTTVLSSRVLYLMLYKELHIEDILCLTFTKKAISEMLMRIYNTLSECVEQRRFQEWELTETQVNFLKIQQANFEKAQIMTIDAFSLRIAKIGMNRQGYLENVTVQASLQNEVETFATQWLLSHRQSNIKDLLFYYQFKDFMNSVLIPLLELCSCIDIDMEATHQKFVGTWLKELEDIQNFFPIKIKEVLELYGVLEKITDSTAKSKDEILALEAMCRKNFSIGFDMQEALNLTFRMPSVKLQELKDGLNEIRNLCSRYNLLLDTYKNREYFKKYYLAFEDMLGDWNIYRREKGLYSYENIAEIARHTLAEDKEIRQWYSNMYKAIIIDEFQDNNIDQKNLLYMLSDIGVEDISHTALQKIPLHSDKYFFVGDPKQSIYKFRGADIEAFRSLSLDNQKKYLSNNYRSSKSLISFFNDCFEKLFADTRINQDQIEYEMQVSPREHSKENIIEQLLSTEECQNLVLQNRDNTDISNISCMFELIRNSETDKSDIELEAFSIANRIRTMVKEQKIDPKDIAVLSRAKFIFDYIVQYLLIYEIDFVIENNAISIRQDVGQDFYSWLTLLVYPEDRSAYAAVLRSPLVGISDNAVLGMLGLRNSALFSVEHEISDESFHAIKEFLKTNEAEDILHIQECSKKYQEAKEILKQGNLLDLLNHFWYSCGYRYVLLRNKKYHIFLEHYNMLKSLVLAHQSTGVYGLLQNIKRILQGERLDDELSVITSKHTSGVSLMTIHASKGLEFPYVILANMNSDLSKGGSSTEGVKKIDNLLYIDCAHPMQESHFLQKNSEKNPDSMYRQTIKNAKSKDRSELLRVLYVAATRAEKALIISGNYPTRAKTGENLATYLKWFYNIGYIIDDKYINEHSVTIVHSVDDLRERQSEEKEDFVQESMIKDKASEYEQIQDMITKELAYTYSERLQIRRTEISPSGITRVDVSTEKEKLSILEVDSILDAHNMYTAFGTYCHYLLSFLNGKGQLPSNIPAMPLKLETQLLPLSTSEFKVFIEDAQRLADNFVSGFMKDILHTQHRLGNIEVYTEYPFLLFNETHEVWVRGIVDLLIVTQKEYIIVDYKVDRYKKLEQYKYQLAAYELAIRTQIFQHTLMSHDNAQKDVSKEIRCILYYLRNGETYTQNMDMEEDELISILLEGKILAEEQTLIIEE